ncbi:MAG: ferredoxin [Pirellulaceae bacterium]
MDRYQADGHSTHKKFSGAAALGKHDLDTARHRAQKLGLGNTSRMIMLCVDRKEAGCASAKQMSESWSYLKKRLKQLRLDKHGEVLRLKMGCCGLCKAGPIAVVMPDAVWYGHCTPKVLDEIIDKHLIEGNVVQKYMIAQPEWANAETTTK